MSSERLPGKILYPLAGVPAISYLVERLELASRVGSVVVATSVHPSDDAVVAYCERAGIRCHRGSLADVAGRLLEVADSLRLAAFVRVNGDSPLLDQRLVDRGIELFNQSNIDLVTNVFPRSFPAGQSVEILSTDALRRAHRAMNSAAEREHVTAHLYRHQQRFSIVNFSRDPPARNVRFTLDTEDDARRLGNLVRSMERPHWSYTLEDLLQIARNELKDTTGSQAV